MDWDLTLVGDFETVNKEITRDARVPIVARLAVIPVLRNLDDRTRPEIFVAIKGSYNLQTCSLNMTVQAGYYQEEDSDGARE
jgi:hypothetical protein